VPIPDEHRDKHGRLHVSRTLQLRDFPEVFAGGDCAVDVQSSTVEGHEYKHLELHPELISYSSEPHKDTKPLPATAQVAYQQGAAIAHNLKAIALGHEPKPAQVNLRGTLLKLGLENSAANIYDVFEVTGEVGHLIRQGTYLELLPTPVHNFKVTTDWLKDEIFHEHMNSGDGGKQAVKVAQVVGGVVVGAIVAKKLLNMLSHDDRDQES
jgi:NADH dehydrogenase FAD-containing subunit